MIIHEKISNLIKKISNFILIFTLGKKKQNTFLSTLSEV